MIRKIFEVGKRDGCRFPRNNKAGKNKKWNNRLWSKKIKTASIVALGLFMALTILIIILAVAS